MIVGSGVSTVSGMAVVVASNKRFKEPQGNKEYLMHPN